MKKEIEIVNHWVNDSGDVEIVLIKSLVKGKKLRNNLFWFSDSNRSMLPSETQISVEEFCKHKCYKQRTFESIEYDIPDDCYMPIF